MQHWEIAKGVFRFTLGSRSHPGSTFSAEVLQNEEMSFYVWDFGVDAERRGECAMTEMKVSGLVKCCVCKSSARSSASAER